MELNDLKTLLNDLAAAENNKKNNIMEMISNRSRGPLAGLEAKFKWNFYLFPIAVIILAWDFIKKPELLHSPSMWMMIAVLFFFFCNFTYNYFIIKRLQHPESAVKENMEYQVSRLERSFKWHKRFLRVYLVVLAALLEISMHYHLDKDFESWYAVNMGLRIMTYAGIVFFLHFVNQRSFRIQYGQHLDNLKNLVKDL